MQLLRAFGSGMADKANWRTQMSRIEMRKMDFPMFRRTKTRLGKTLRHVLD